MPRKGNVPKRDVLPDPVYGSVTVAKLINSIMLDGKKGTAQSIVYGAFDMIKEQTGEEPLEVFEKAMNNIMPVLEVKAKRIGGANYQVPVEVRPERRQTGQWKRTAKQRESFRKEPQECKKIPVVFF